jgi:hypothetical protein
MVLHIFFLAGNQHTMHLLLAADSAALLVALLVAPCTQLLLLPAACLLVLWLFSLQATQKTLWHLQSPQATAYRCSS